MTRMKVTRNYRAIPCQHCDGAGEVLVNDTNPHGYGPDPQCDETVACNKCDNGDVVVWVDPIVQLRAARRAYRKFGCWAAENYGRIRAEVVTDVVLP